MRDVHAPDWPHNLPAVQKDGEKGTVKLKLELCIFVIYH